MKRNIVHKSVLGLLAAALLATTWLSPVLAEEQREPGGAIARAAVTVATVVEVDQATRNIVLRNQDGTTSSFTAGPEVRNFDQIKRGDQVLAEYFGAFAVALDPADKGKIDADNYLAVTRAKLGEKPGFSVKQLTVVSGVVRAVVPEKRDVTIEGPENTITVKVADDVDLGKVKVGDTVQAALLSMFAVKVEPAPKVSGTISFTTTAIAAGIGFEWGKGSMTMYDGSTHTFKVNGLSIVDVGISEVKAEGKIYHLVEAGDLEGTYFSGEAGATLFGGGSVVAMKNSKGVVIQLQTQQKGLKLTLAPGGLTISEVQ